MAKIFRTESLNLGGNLLLEAGSADAFEIKSASGSTLMSRQTIENDISSLQAVDVKNESDLSVDVSSLAAIDSGHDTDISSLQAADVKNESDLSVDISSLQAADVKNESDLSVDVSSLAAIDSGHDTDISSLAAVRGEPDHTHPDPPDSYTESTFTDGVLTAMTTWTNSLKSTLVGSKAFVYTNGLLTQVVEKDENDAVHLTKTITYDSNGNLESITKDYA